MSNCQVKVEQGILQGKECQTHNGHKYYSFEGIPYAQPPLGKLRFKAPQKPDNWSGVRDATEPGNRSAQINILGKAVPEGSEDCLYLNIYTPVLPVEEIKKLPVIFFIHGGRLTIGYGDYYKPNYFIERGVILVTINYRLNIFGFLCLNTPEVPGNAGCKDAVMALKWIKRNIANFNGDDNNITVQGESAGAAVAMSFMTSKMAYGLFDRLIIQSGTSLAELFLVEEDPIDLASKIASYLNKDTKDKQELYELFLNSSVDDLLYAFVSADLDRPPAIINTLLLPVIEKKFHNVERFFEEPPIVVIKENRFMNVPIIMTVQSDEAALFLRRDEHGNIIYEDDLQYFIPRYLFIEHNTAKALKFVDSIQNFYFKGRKLDESLRNEYLNLCTDHYFTRDMIFTLDFLSKFQDNLYLCRFGYMGNLSLKVMKSLGFKGASHGDLIQYIFYRQNKVEVASDKDREVVDTLNDMWTNFAKSGNPSLKDLEWKPYNSKTRLCLNIEDDIKVKPYPDFERIKFWLDLIRERSKL